MNKTPLYQLHINAGAKMGPFAGYDMPLYYGEGVIKEHEWVRSHVGLFDVSHMGQVMVSGSGSGMSALDFFEKITPSSYGKAPSGRAKYTVMTNENGGIVDDLIVSRLGDDKFFAVINAGCKDKDLQWMRSHLPGNLTLDHLEDRALMALQGPEAEKVLRETLKIETTDQPYMWGKEVRLPDGTELIVSRLGYTGEDGFEISVPVDKAVSVWDQLVGHRNVKPVGLAARDSLRLEMGYPLYGHDIDESTTPVEAGLSWVIGKNNETFMGRDNIDLNPVRKRIGVKLQDKGVAREGAKIIGKDGNEIGMLTSGGFSPILQSSIGMGYVPASYEGQIVIDVRGRRLKAEICSMPFIAPKTKSMKKNAA